MNVSFDVVTWKNLMGLAMFFIGIRSLYGAVITGKLDTGWILSADIKRSRPVFFIKCAIAVFYTFVCGCLALGLGNSSSDFNLLTLLR